MDSFLRKAQVIAIIAVFAGVITFAAQPSYASGAYSEFSYITKHPRFNSSRKCTSVRLRWSKAYSILEDGTVKAASGYEIQYANNKAFRHARKVFATGDSKSRIIKIRKLNTRKKYRKYASRYRFRIRSYVRVNGRKLYSKWVNAGRSKRIRVYYPVTLGSINAKRNVVTGTWQKVSGANGYLIYLRKAGASQWKKVLKSTRRSQTSFKVDNLEYDSKYEFAVMSYRYVKTTNPGGYRTSALHILHDITDKYNMSIPEFSLDRPDVKVGFRDHSVKVLWNKVEGSQKYYLEVSTDKKFPKSKVQEIVVESKESVKSYSKALKDYSADDEIFIRVRAGSVYKNQMYYSEYSKVRTFKYSDATYKVKFNWNNATSGTMSMITVRSSEVFNLPANKFKRTGYKFAGWSIEKNSEINMRNFQYGPTDYRDCQEVTSLGKPGDIVTLYACWKGNSPTSAGDWAKKIANDDGFCYGLVGRNQCWYCGGDWHTYNCNSFVSAAYTHGTPYLKEGTYGSTKPTWWEARGFTRLGKISAANMKKGDVICCWKSSKKIWSHVMIAYSTTRVIHAARFGEDDASIRLEDMVSRLGKYSSYCVLRLK